MHLPPLPKKGGPKMVTFILVCISAVALARFLFGQTERDRNNRRSVGSLLLALASFGAFAGGQTLTGIALLAALIALRRYWATH